MTLPRKPGPGPERMLGRFDGALLAGLLICSALVTVFLLVGRAFWLAPQTTPAPGASPLAETLTVTLTPLPTAIIAMAGTSEPSATPPVPANTPEVVPTPRVEPLDLAGLFAGMRFEVRGQGVPGQTIALYDNDLLVGTRVVDPDGSWEIALAQGLPIGEHRLVAVAIGLDGGRSEVAPVGFTVLSGPVAPALSPGAPLTIAPVMTVVASATPSLPPTSTPTVPPTKLPLTTPTVVALALTQPVEASPVPSETPAPSATPTLIPATPTGVSASPTPISPEATVPPTETLPTTIPATEAPSTATPTVALTALGLLADRAADGPVIVAHRAAFTDEYAAADAHAVANEHAFANEHAAALSDATPQPDTAAAYPGRAGRRNGRAAPGQCLHPGQSIRWRGAERARSGGLQRVGRAGRLRDAAGRGRSGIGPRPGGR